MFLLLIYLAIWEECRAAKRHSRSSERLGRRFLQRFPPKSRGSLFSVICRVPLFHRNEFDSALSNEDRGFILRLVGSYDCGMVFETVFSEERVDGNHAFFVDCRGKSLPRSVVDGLVEWFVPQKIVRF